MKLYLFLKKTSHFLLASILLFSAIAFLDYNAFQKIQPKSGKNQLRIGYINLHEKAISKAELEYFSTFDCDVWLFAEWNGNNLDALKSFEKSYVTTYEKQDSSTYGFYILSKKVLNFSAKEIDKEKRPYTCDYSKIMLSKYNLGIALLHAPPPVPTCDFQTHSYITDCLNYLDSNVTATNQLIIGDLNTTPCQAGYQNIIQADFIDIFDNNRFFNGTYGGIPFFPKLLRIDYMFYKGKISLNYAERFYLSSSDHCGLIADVKLYPTTILE